MPYASASGYTYDAADCVQAVRDGARGRRRAGLRRPARRQRSGGQAARPGLFLPSPRHRRHRRRTCRGRGRARPAGRAASARRARARATRRSSRRSWRQSLGVPVERIEIRQGDTRTIPHGGGTGGSSSTIISGTTLQARRRRGDPARPRPRRRAAGDGAGRHRLSRRQPSRSSAPTAASACSSWRPGSRSRATPCSRDKIEVLSRPASWSARSRSIPRPARCASTA